MNDSVAWFATPAAAALRRRRMTPAQWTALGALSIPLWALWPSLALHLRALPPLEALAIMFSCGCVSFRVLHVGTEEPPAARSLRGWVPSLVYAGALAGGDLSFLLSTHRLPAAQANLLSYLWPVMIGLFGAAAGLFRPNARLLAGLGLGFAGACILLWDGELRLSVSGMALALASGALWATYCVFRLAWKEPTGNLLARGCGISALLCALLHLGLEPTVVPNAVEIACLGVSGFLALGLGNYLWDQGFRRGDSHRLAVMAYATPLCSTLLLASWGAALLTRNLLVGALVIVGAGMLSRSETPRDAPAP
ncbi:MAG TPA: EamA family transporter [Steroidobacteraceae bacterium]|nr:EamA family transporter [Steroidobacteraceae bacterium]